jgi:hypothetical protein
MEKRDNLEVLVRGRQQQDEGQRRRQHKEAMGRADALCIEMKHLPVVLRHDLFLLLPILHPPP